MKDVGSWRRDEAQAVLIAELPPPSTCMPQQQLDFQVVSACWNDDNSWLLQHHVSRAELQLHGIQVEQFSSHNIPGLVSSRVSNSLQLEYNPLPPVAGTAAAAAYGASSSSSMCDKLLLQASSAGAGAPRHSQFREPLLGIHGIDSVVQDCSIRGGGLLHLQQQQRHPQQLQLEPDIVVPDVVRVPATIETRRLDTGFEAGFSPSGNEATLLNMREMQQQASIAAGMKSFNTGLGFSNSCGNEAAVSNMREMQQHTSIAAGMKSFNTGLGFSRSCGNEAAVSNMREMQQQTGIAAGMKSFNTGFEGFSNPHGDEAAVRSVWEMQQQTGMAAGMKSSFDMGFEGFSPVGNEAAAVMDVQEAQQQTSIAAGMKSFNTGFKAGFGPSGNEAAATNMQEMQQQTSIAAGMKSFNTGLGRPSGRERAEAAATNMWEMQQQTSIAAGMKSFNTGLGFGPGGRETAMTNVREMRQQTSIAAGMKSFVEAGLGFSGSEAAGVTNMQEMQQQTSIAATGMKSFQAGLGFSPTGSEAAGVINMQEMQQQMSMAAGMKSFNPGPYVGSAAVNERQDVTVAGNRAWLENKCNTSALVHFDIAHQLGKSTTTHHIAGLQQPSRALESPGIKWPLRMSSTPGPLPAALPVAPVLSSGHTGLGTTTDGKTSIVMQPKDVSILKGALPPRCPPAASANMTFVDSHKRPISSQGEDAFQRSFQNAGKKPAAAGGGGTPWSGQGACSRLEYFSTLAHKQVAQSIASGSSRPGALGPAVLNTSTKPWAHQSSTNDLQNIAAQSAGKKPVAPGGGTPWSGGQEACSRLEYLSTAAHKQVSQSMTASGGSSRAALSPALNTDLKPRACQGSANDPQSIAARVRRERISERLKYLQTLIPNGDKVDMVTMLEKAINYVQCLELQIRMLKDDSLWPKAVGPLPNTLQELQELAGPEIAGQGQCKFDVVESSKPKVSTESTENLDRANPSSSHSSYRVKKN